MTQASLNFKMHVNNQGEKQILSKEASNVPLARSDEQPGEAHKKNQKSKPQLIKCAECPKVYVRPGAYMNHVEKNHKKIEENKEAHNKSEEEETALYRDMSVMLKAADQEDDKEATEMGKEADVFEERRKNDRTAEERLGISTNKIVTLNLDEIQTNALPAALEPTETNDQPPKNMDLIDLVNVGNKELELFLITTKVSLTNEPLVEVNNTVLPSSNSAASHYMNKSLTSSQRVLFPEAPFLLEMADEDAEKEIEQEKEIETATDKEVEGKSTSAEQVAKDIAEELFNKIARCMTETPSNSKNKPEDISLKPMEDERRVIKCRRCTFTTETINDLVKHTKRKHTCQYKCKKCKETFIFKSTLNKHTIRRHPEIRIVNSQLCNEECKMKDEVIEHKESVIDKKEKQIENLNKQLEKKYMQHEKLKEKHGNNLKSLNDKRKVVEENKRLRTDANNASDLLKQIQERNLKLEDELKVKTQIIEADKTLRKEMEHQNQIEWMSDEVRKRNIPQYKCVKCEWKTHNKKYLIGHMTSHKSEEDRHQILRCNKCDFTTKNNTSLKEHQCRDHIEKVVELKCNKCQKVFTAHNSLLQHAKTKHEDTSRLPVGHQMWTRQPEPVKFLCVECPKEFLTDAELNEHTYTHIFNIPCNQCDEMFETKQDLSHHTRTSHKNNQSNFMRQKRMCRYYQQGRCHKGPMCLFSHEFANNSASQKVQTNWPQACRRGPRCEFLTRGTCYYFHEGYGEQGVRRQEFRGQEQEISGQEQEFRDQWQEQHVENRHTKPCHFQERCWNTACAFSHQDFYKNTEFLENY